MEEFKQQVSKELIGIFDAYLRRGMDPNLKLWARRTYNRYVTAQVLLSHEVARHHFALFPIAYPHIPPWSPPDQEETKYMLRRLGAIELPEELAFEEDLDWEEESGTEIAVVDDTGYTGTMFRFVNHLYRPVALTPEPALFNGEKDPESFRSFAFRDRKETYWFRQFGIGEDPKRSSFLLKPGTNELIEVDIPSRVVKAYRKQPPQGKKYSVLRFRFTLRTEHGTYRIASKRIPLL